MNDIKIGTLVPAGDALRIVPAIMPYGFETFSLSFWDKLAGRDIDTLAANLLKLTEPHGCAVSTLSIYTNPLLDNQKGEDGIAAWKKLIDAAPLFKTDLVTGFAGRLPGRPVEDSLPRFAKVFSDIAAYARERNVRIAFENCSMGGDWQSGDWNIAFTPKAWEAIFAALPYDNVGLEWEPCHQLVRLAEPIPQLRKWAPKIFHLHGKDASVAWDVVREHGISGAVPFAWDRTPGFGDSNWADIISILRMNGYKGSIDIEGFHDPVYCGELEYTGQVHALNYLKRCRGGDFVPNPV